MGICGVAVPLIFLCGVFDLKPAMFGEKKFLADPLRCCFLFDTFDRLTLVE